MAGYVSWLVIAVFLVAVSCPLTPVLSKSVGAPESEDNIERSSLTPVIVFQGDVDTATEEGVLIRDEIESEVDTSPSEVFGSGLFIKTRAKRRVGARRRPARVKIQHDRRQNGWF
ncbi:uncharacterized protein [Cherax quadricarinatus]|uniref:uncharacterized protein n=1 Tax=Cherax quadricarinatus TaxID=27406 RepID=UPI00387E81F0